MNRNSLHQVESTAFDNSNSRLVYDLTDSSTFSADYNTAPLQILAHYGIKPLHRVRLTNPKWNIERMSKDLARALIRSDYGWSLNETQWTDLIFGTRQGTFIHYDHGMISVYAPTHRKALRVALKLERYLDLKKDDCASYNLLRSTSQGMDTESVRLDKLQPLDNETLGLHYGKGFIQWHESLMEKLGTRESGLSILEGSPGTGKTSYLRQLMLRLRASHRFYFVPPTHAGIVNDPDFIGFWTKEQRRHKDLKFVMILEDSEKALMKREDDNRSQVSALLNITDGLLSDFLKLQVLCTINCSSSEIDQALIRPGRLLAHKVFGRLKREDARRLADHLGKKIPSSPDHSLAEIFNEAAETPERDERLIGFAA